MAKALQPLDAALLVSPMPVANRVVVQQQGLRDALAAPALVEKDDGVRAAGDARAASPSRAMAIAACRGLSLRETRRKSCRQPDPIRPSRQAKFGFSISRGIAPSWPVEVRASPEAAFDLVKLRGQRLRLHCERDMVRRGVETRNVVQRRRGELDPRSMFGAAQRIGRVQPRKAAFPRGIRG